MYARSGPYGSQAGRYSVESRGMLTSAVATHVMQEEGPTFPHPRTLAHHLLDHRVLSGHVHSPSTPDGNIPSTPATGQSTPATGG